MEIYMRILIRMGWMPYPSQGVGFIHDTRVLILYDHKPPCLSSASRISTALCYYNKPRVYGTQAEPCQGCNLLDLSGRPKSWAHEAPRHLGLESSVQLVLQKTPPRISCQ